MKIIKTYKDLIDYHYDIIHHNLELPMMSIQFHLEPDVYQSIVDEVKLVRHPHKFTMNGENHTDFLILYFKDISIKILKTLNNGELRGTSTSTETSSYPDEQVITTS